MLSQVDLQNVQCFNVILVSLAFSTGSGTCQFISEDYFLLKCRGVFVHQHSRCSHFRFSGDFKVAGGHFTAFCSDVDGSIQHDFFFSFFFHSSRSFS